MHYQQQKSLTDVTKKKILRVEDPIEEKLPLTKTERGQSSPKKTLSPPTIPMQKSWRVLPIDLQ